MPSTAATPKMLHKPRALVLTGQGINCERETCEVLTDTGFDTAIIHAIDLLNKPDSLLQADFFVLAGGFSYGDHLGAGMVLAEKLSRMRATFHAFLEKPSLILGICNGAQVLCHLNLFAKDALPWAFDRNQRSDASGDYECRWVHVRAASTTPFFSEGDVFPIAVAHAEGRLLVATNDALPYAENDANPYEQASANTITQTDEPTQTNHLTNRTNPTNPTDHIALQYCDAEGTLAHGAYPTNPNGSMHDAAALSAHHGRVLAMMPHPERAFYPWQYPAHIAHSAHTANLFQNALAYFMQTS